MSKLELTNEASAMQKYNSAIAERGGRTTTVEQLIQKYCPDGVEYHPIGDYLSYEQPTKYLVESTKYDDSYPTPVLTAGQSFILGYTKETTGIFEASKAVPVIIFDDFTTSSHWVDFSFKVKSSAMKMLRPVDEKKALFRYLYYCMKNILYVPGDHTRQWIGTYSQFEIPIPPLPVQEEIVRVLDTFTELQAELQAELQKRLQQYNYYRDNLLSFEGREDVEWKKLGDVMTIQRGASPRPIQNFLTDDENGVPWIKIGDVSPQSKYISSTKERVTKEGASKSRYLKKGSFILSNSMSFGRPYILEIDGCIHDGWISMCDFQKSLNSDFLYHVLRSNTVQSYWVSKANSGGAVANLNSDIVRDTLIPIPSFKEQQKVVDVLDRFNALTSDLSQGLPAEIEKRRQQYEYYRDKLLTFKRKEA